MSFGKNLRAARAERGLTRAALANSSGYPVRTLEEWEHERVSPRVTNLLDVADALDVSIDALLGRGKYCLPEYRIESDD